MSPLHRDRLVDNSPSSDAGRRYSGVHRYKRDSAAVSTSPTLSPYPLPYHHSHSSRSSHPTSCLDGSDSDPTRVVADEPPPPLNPSRNQRHHSVPDVIYKHGPRFPSSSLHGGVTMHGARARFVSLPADISSFPGIDTECDRLERACGRAPTALLRIRDELPPSSPHQPRGDGPPPTLAPKWAHWALVLRIKRALRKDGKDVRDYIEAPQIDELYHRDVEERARRERERGRMARIRSGQEPSDLDESTTHIFGVPLNESILRAPASAILGGYRHDLPLVVFLCVEELYRTGIYKSGLFRDLPNRQRHRELISLFDAPPAFGEGMSLRAESTPDICALLLTYLKELPEPVLTPYLFNAFWNWCVRPSVKREDERTRKEQDEEEDLRAHFFQTGQRPPRPSRRILFEKARLRAAQDEAAETGQMAIARDLLRLLPTHSFSLIVYLCAFFTQVPLCPENGITLEDVGRIFGPSVFGGPVPAARRMMVWFLKRWNRVSDGLLDAEPNEAAAAGGSSSCFSSTLHRRDVRVLERADSFELLAPEEEDEEERDFHSPLADPESRHAYHRTDVETTALLSQSQSQSRHDSDIIAQEKAIPLRPPGWSDEIKGKDSDRALEPEDSRSQATLWDGQRQSDRKDQSLLPQHVFAPTTHRRSRRSSGSQPSDELDSSSAHAGEGPRRWRSSDAQLVIALSRLHEARARIDELEHAVADAATQSERAQEKLAIVAAVTVNEVDSYARFEQELKLTALERDEANELVKNICAVLKGVVQPATYAEAR